MVVAVRVEVARVRPHENLAEFGLKCGRRANTLLALARSQLLTRIPQSPFSTERAVVMSLLVRLRRPLPHIRAATVAPTRHSSPSAASCYAFSTSQATASSSRDIQLNPFSYNVADKVEKTKGPSPRPEWRVQAQQAHAQAQAQRARPADDDRPPSAPGTAYPPAQSPAPNPLKAAEEETRPETTRSLYRLYAQATRNNIIITFAHPNGNPIRTFTGGMFGFKHVNRSTHEAAHQCAVHAFKLIEQQVALENDMLVHLYLSGFGKGRDAVQKAFLSSEGENIRHLVSRVTDKTPLKIGGERAKKRRRL